MKNLFEYATSKLSQDAFLCWLFDNYNCENQTVQKISAALLGELAPDSGTGTVEKLKIFRQLHHTDVVIDFRRCGMRHVLVIEDKTFSTVRENQPENYQNAIERDARFSGAKFHYVVYKTDCKIPTETEKRITPPWRAFYVEAIQSFFEKQPHSDCIILEQYREHIRLLAEKTERVSEKPMAEWKNDRLLFRTYIIKELIPAATPLLEKIGVKPFLWGKHYYPSLGIRNFFGNLMFSLEIIFRPESDGANVVVRLSEKDGSASEEIRNLFREELQTHTDLFRGKNNKWCIAVETPVITKQLLYENSRIGITHTCMELIHAFVQVSMKLTNNSIGEKICILQSK